MCLVLQELLTKFACTGPILSRILYLLRKIDHRSKYYYYMANPVFGKSLCIDWFFFGQDFAVRTVSMEMVQSVYFCFEAKRANSKFATKTAKNYQKKLKRLKFFRNFRDGWGRQTFLSASRHRKCILLSETECHIIKNLLT